MTFSLAARCPHTGAFGMVIASSSPAVAARCVHLRPRAGVVASQNITDPRLGDALLDLLAAGESAGDAVSAVAASDPTAPYRQLTAVDSLGRSAVYSGEHTLGVHNAASRDGTAAAGNLLASTDVVDALIEGYQGSTEEDFTARLMAGLAAAAAQGGEAGPVHSAGIKVLHPSAGWASTDLRVDWHDEPIRELQRLWQLWLPQRAGYIVRGLDPGVASSFDVPGDPGNG